MSFIRAKSRQTNQNAYLQNRLANFTNPPMRTGDLHVEKNETVGGDLDISGNLKATSFYATGNFYLDSHILIPPGTVIQSAAIAVPAGWFECNGAILNKVTYAGLFAAIGNTYGNTYGETDLSFNLPDARGRVCVGAGDGTGPALTNRVLGDDGGAETHTLSVNEIPAHSHSLTRRSNMDDGSYDTNNLLQDESSAATTDRLALGPFNTFETGGGAAHNNMQPFIVLRHLIKY